MPLGPGKYDDLCTEVRERSGARAAIVIVFEGNRGAGFSFQGDPESMIMIPRLLRFVAEQIEEGTKEETQQW